MSTIGGNIELLITKKLFKQKTILALLKPAAFTNVLFSNIFMVSNQKQATLDSRIHIAIHLLFFGFFFQELQPTFIEFWIFSRAPTIFKFTFSFNMMIFKGLRLFRED